VALGDDVARVVRELWRLNVAVGFQSRVGWEPGTPGKLAKAAGCTEETLAAWLAGEAQPSTAQALAVLDALPLPAVGVLASLNGSA
jgi:hypothetical protein